MKITKSIIQIIIVLFFCTSSPAEDQGTIVHLFEWKWTDIAQECEEHLGPAGYSAVQVSPPNEHRPGREWWQRYQPVSYKLCSRSGTEAEFNAMVDRCYQAGVSIYVDAVINHMAGTIAEGAMGKGVCGSRFRNYHFPGLYSDKDFHQHKRNIASYKNRLQVQEYELLDLMDLDTGSSRVQLRLASYLIDLLDRGVSGFRIDASKHIAAAELNAILQQVREIYPDVVIYQEVIDLGGEPIRAQEYYRNGQVTEFVYSAEIGRVFRHGKLAWLKHFAEGWQKEGSGKKMMPASQAIIFVDNHDNQRGHGAGGDNILTESDGKLYELANIFMLAWPYGQPRIMSGYKFEDRDQGPPEVKINSGNPIINSGCSPGWICEHRKQAVQAMVDFRNRTTGEPVNHWWDNGDNCIAFSRGDKGHVIINNENSPQFLTLQTGFPEGQYCDIIADNSFNQRCTGLVLKVNRNGTAQFEVPAQTAVAFLIKE